MDWRFITSVAFMLLSLTSCLQVWHKNFANSIDQSNRSTHTTDTSAVLSSESSAVANGSLVSWLKDDDENSTKTAAFVVVAAHKNLQLVVSQNATENRENAADFFKNTPESLPSFWNENLTENKHFSRNFTVSTVNMSVDPKNWTLYNFFDNKTFENSTEFNSTGFVISSVLGFLNSDSVYNALSISLISVGILAIVSLLILIIWRRRCSGISGEWVIKDTVYGKGQPMVAAFDNECFSMDSKVGSYIPMVEANGVKNCKPPSAGTSKNGKSRSVHATGKVETEMMEMIEKKFSSNSSKLP